MPNLVAIIPSDAPQARYAPNECPYTPNHAGTHRVTGAKMLYVEAETKAKLNIFLTDHPTAQIVTDPTTINADEWQANAYPESFNDAPPAERERKHSPVGHLMRGRKRMAEDDLKRAQKRHERAANEEEAWQVKRQPRP